MNLIAAGSLVLLVATGCGSGSARVVDAAPKSPEPQTSPCVRYDTDAATPEYATVQQIFDENCGDGCHVPAADLQLTPGPAWSRIVGQPAPAAEACGGVLVEPGAPNASYLYQKISSEMPCAGDQMPRGDLGPVPLPDCVVSYIERWILEGAPGPAGILFGDGGESSTGADP